MAARLVREAHFWFEGGGSKELVVEILKNTHPEVYDNPAFVFTIHPISTWPKDETQLLYYVFGALLNAGKGSPPDADSWTQQHGTAHGKRFCGVYMRDPR